MTDGFFSRPGLGRVGVGKVAPSPARVDGCLARVGVTRLAAVVPVHTHFDHALDSALVADRTGAQLVGGESAANVGRGHGLAAEPPGDRRVGHTNSVGRLRHNVGRSRAIAHPTGFPAPSISR